MQTVLSLHKDPRQLNKKGLAEVYKILGPHLFRYAFRLLGDSNMAEDCVAETFSRFQTTFKNGARPHKNVKAYLYQIAHNCIMDYYRHRKPEVNLDFEQLITLPENSVSATNQQLEGERVRMALLKLTGEQRQVILLRFYEEWSHEETAVAIGKTVEATRALQYRALNVLRRMLLVVEE